MCTVAALAEEHSKAGETGAAQQTHSLAAVVGAAVTFLPLPLPLPRPRPLPRPLPAAPFLPALALAGDLLTALLASSPTCRTHYIDTTPGEYHKCNSFTKDVISASVSSPIQS